MNENLKKVFRRNKYVSTTINSPPSKMYIVGIAGITNNCCTSE
jgi:hypothetical protein